MPIVPFFSPPESRDYWIADIRLPACVVVGKPLGGVDTDGLVRADLRVAGGRIAAVAPRGTAPESAAQLNGGMVFPCFVDIHTHLDKGHIWPRAENSDGTFDGAIRAVLADKLSAWKQEDVERRFDFALRAAFAHGTAAVRTHIDSNPENAETSWAVFRKMREVWRGKIELQATSILAAHLFTAAYAPNVADLVARSGGVLGAVLRPSGEKGALPISEIDEVIDRVFVLATERGLDVDLHVDESGEQSAAALIRVARTAVKKRFKGRILAGHCCSLAMQSDSFVTKTLDAAKDAGIAIVSLPLCNLYLQDRKPQRTPRWRGVTLLHEAKAAGLAVALASDNTRDPFYAFGDLDMFEVYTQATRIAHLDRPYGDWPCAVGRTPAEIMGLSDCGRIAVDAAANLVLFKARNFSELLSRPQADRSVLRAGLAIDTNPPDYAELDDLFGRTSRRS